MRSGRQEGARPVGRVVPAPENHISAETIQLAQALNLAAPLMANDPDLVAYVSLDHLLLNFALPTFRKKFPAHARFGASGTLFRDNGLRPPVTRSAKIFRVPPTWRQRSIFWGMGFSLKEDMDAGVMESNWLTWPLALSASSIWRLRRLR